MLKYFEHGKVKIKLGEMLERTGMSKGMFSKCAEMERTQLNRYINNDVAMVDLDVLARMCSVLECEVSDILEYVPPENGGGESSENK